jgi:hypothetical protein
MLRLGKIAAVVLIPSAVTLATFAFGVFATLLGDPVAGLATEQRTFVLRLIFLGVTPVVMGGMATVLLERFTFSGQSPKLHEWQTRLASCCLVIAVLVWWFLWA